MVRVCPRCSNVDIDKLKEVVGEENVKTGCIGMCRAYSKEAVVKVDGEVLIKETQQELFDELSK
jgi:uncharacterized protein YuzB (UPF0349 family)